jgi:hypothetical protein
MTMPSQQEMIRYLVWGTGKVMFMGINSGLLLARALTRCVVQLFDSLLAGVSVLERYYDMLVIPSATHAEAYDITETDTIYEPLPALQDSPQSDTTAIAHSVDLLDIINGRHVLILGSTGTGKSTLAQWIAQQKNAVVKVYDPDATPQEWEGIEVVGRGGDFGAVEDAMQVDLKTLESRAIIRGKRGDKGITDELCIICEEFPAIASECESAATWMGKLARRGRKPKMFIIVLSQANNVTALGIQGDGQIRENFCVVRLGKFAVSHAKHLKNEALMAWLQDGKYRALADETPVQLPDLSKQ